MADQENNDIGIADTSTPKLEGSEPNHIGSTDVVKVDERAECENLGVSSCALEQEIRKESEPIAMLSSCVANVDGEVCENLGISGCNIEEGMGIISLVSGLESSVIIGGNGGKGEIKMDEDESESSESESDNPSSATSSTSSSSSGSDGSSSDDDDVEDDREEGQQEKGEGHTEKIEVEVEEGEIKDSNGQELVTETAANNDDDADDDYDDDEEDMEIVIGSGINDGDYDDGDEDVTAMKGPIRSMNELQNLPPVPPVNVTLGPHHKMLAVGVVMSIINTQVIVEGVEKHDPLSEGSILWITESRTPLGLVDEIFGPVKNPYYIVRYNSENEVPISIHGGTTVSFVPEFANYLLCNKDLYKKGYDKSDLDDEEVSDEGEFSDDEKEAQYRKQKMTKRGISDQNPQKQKIHKRKAPQKRGGGVPHFPVRPAAPSPDDKNSSFSGIRGGPSGATSMAPPFTPASADRNLASISTGGVWTNGMLLQQPQSALHPSGIPPNGIPWFPGNAQNSYQLPMPGMPFQQQLGHSLGSLPTTMLPGLQPNIFARPTYPQGLVGQVQMSFGLSSHIPQLQPPHVFAGEQGFLPNKLQSEGNNNSHSGAIPDHQSRIGAFPNYGRKNFNQGGRKGWRPSK